MRSHMLVAHREEQITTEDRCQEVTGGGGTQGGADHHRGQVPGDHMWWWHTGRSDVHYRCSFKENKNQSDKHGIFFYLHKVAG